MKLLLIDGTHGVIRFFHATPELRFEDGRHCNALYGMCNAMLSMLKGFRRGWEPSEPTHFAAVFDHARRASFRSAIYPAYKAQRPPQADALRDQFAMAKDMLTEAFAIPVVCVPEVEADDVMATYARMVGRQDGEAMIVSNDKDLMQVVTDRIRLYDPIKGQVVGVQEVVDRFGVIPALVPDAQALIGDTSDNVPGVPGIGPRIAARLINAHGSLEGVLAAAEQVKPERFRAPIRALVPSIRLAQTLVTLDDEVEVPALDTLAWSAPDGLRIGAYFRRLGFETLARQADMS